MTQSPNPTPDAGEAFEPTWFLSPLDTPANDELAERYRHHREAAVEPAPLRDLIRALPPAEASAIYNDDELLRPAPRKRQATPRTSLAKTYALAALAAVLAGATSGYGAAQFGPPVIVYFTGATIELAGAPASSRLTPVTELGKKPVPTALLMVSDAEGSANTPIPLIVLAEPPAEDLEMLLKISGVPSSAYLTSGWKVSADSWHVRQPDLGKLNLISTDNASQRFDLAIAGFEAKSGDMVTPVKEVTVSITPQAPAILPVSAPPPTVREGLRR